jgi:DNA-binding transcriptional LysR family regulator
MELYQLRTFVAVAEAGHLTQASERLHLSQPAVSAHIKALEQELEIRLFERTATGMELTAAGRELLAHAQKVLDAAEEMKNAAMELKGEVVGTLRIGTVSDPASNRLGELLAFAVKRHPRLKLELHHEMTGAALEAVRDGELDGSFYFGDEPGSEFVALPLRQFVYLIAAPAAWADRVKHADWAEMAALPWVRTPTISTHTRLIEALFIEHGVDPPPNQIEADDESVLVNLVIAGVGVSLMRDDIAREQVKAGEICVWPKARLRTMLWFVSDAQRAGEPLIDALLGLVCEVWGLDPSRRAQAAVS